MRRLIATAASALLLLAVSAVPVLADGRCSGRPGVQVWQDANKGGPSFVACWPSTGTGGIFYPRLSSVTYGLSFGANWNDRITSYETFNFTGHSMTFYVDNSYSSASYGGRVVTTSGNGYVSNLGNLYSTQPSGYSDVISSFKTTK